MVACTWPVSPVDSIGLSFAAFGLQAMGLPRALGWKHWWLGLWLPGPPLRFREPPDAWRRSRRISLLRAAAAYGLLRVGLAWPSATWQGVVSSSLLALLPALAEAALRRCEQGAWAAVALPLLDLGCGWGEPLSSLCWLARSQVLWPLWAVAFGWHGCAAGSGRCPEASLFEVSLRWCW